MPRSEENERFKVDEADEVLFEGGLGDTKKAGIKIGDSTNSCCICIPIKTGVTIIGLYLLVIAAMAAYAAVAFFLKTHVIMGVVYCLVNLPLFVAAFYFFKWIQNDSMETRAKLPTACIYVMFALIVSTALSLVLMIITFISWDDFWSTLVGNGIDFLFYFYFAGVCKRFSQSA